MKLAATLAGATLIILSLGCDQSKPVILEKTQPIPYQRFVPIAASQAQILGIPWNGYFALDTKTGILCLTEDDFIPDKFAGTPICAKLVVEYPDATNKVTSNSQKSVSLKAAMALPINKGKSEEDVRKDIKAHGYKVTQ